MGYLQEMARSGYNKESISPFHQVMIPWLFSYHSIPKDEAVVDIGAGQGHCLIPLHMQGWKNLIAVDSDEYNFNIFRENYKFLTLKCDISSESVKLKDNSVGAVICFHLIEHIQNSQNLLSEIYRILKIRGKVFFVTPDWRKQYKTFWRDPTHVRPYDKESIARLLRMYNFKVAVFPWGSSYGLGRISAFKYFPSLGMIGKDLLAVGTK